jgi:NAD(P)-dependent dehydrogenase (short-subunit alcohol dehydrogenase family)
VGLLEGRVVLVSGVGPGLGRETAAAVLREGGRAVMTDMIGDRVRLIGSELDPGGTRSLIVEADVTSEQQCADLASKVRERFGRLDGLVNVAALDTAVGGLMDEGILEDWDVSAAVNVKGTLRMTRSLVPLMMEPPSAGSIVLIASTAFLRPRRTRFNVAYAMTKGALATATYYLAEELGPNGIRTNTIAPGWKWGPVVEAYFEGEAERRGVDPKSLVDAMCEELSLRRMATDADVANTAVFFLSDMSRAITGQIIFVDGGQIFR